MRWLLVPAGAIPLVILGSGLRDGWWPLGVAALLTLGVSLFGRWPATGTAFCLCLIAMVTAQAQLSMLTASETAVSMGLYLLVLDALESGISGGIDWAAGQVVPTLGLLGGIVVVTSAESMPLTTSPVLLIAASAATATLLWWVGVDEYR